MSVTAAGVGIFNNSPVFALDVASTVRFQAVSTLALNISSINGQTFGAPIQSTVVGLGSAGYLSTSQLTSTVVGLGQIYLSTAVSQTTITSTVQGLGTVGYLSTSQLTSTVVGLGQIYLSTAVSQTAITSTVQGLGTVGYVSTASLVSTFSASGS